MLGTAGVVVVTLAETEPQLPLLLWPIGVLGPIDVKTVGECGEIPRSEATATPLEYGEPDGDLFVFEFVAMAAVVDDEAVVEEFNDDKDDDVDEFEEADDDDEDDEDDDKEDRVVEQTSGPSVAVVFGVGVRRC